MHTLGGCRGANAHIPGGVDHDRIVGDARRVVVGGAQVYKGTRIGPEQPGGVRTCGEVGGDEQARAEQALRKLCLGGIGRRFLLQPRYRCAHTMARIAVLKYHEGIGAFASIYE